MIFNSFRFRAFNYSWKYFEVLQMAQPHIILLWYVIGSHWLGVKEQSIVSLIITLFALVYLYLSKPPSSGEEIG